MQVIFHLAEKANNTENVIQMEMVMDTRKRKTIENLIEISLHVNNRDQNHIEM